MYALIYCSKEARMNSHSNNFAYVEVFVKFKIDDLKIRAFETKKQTKNIHKIQNFYSKINK